MAYSFRIGKLNLNRFDHPPRGPRSLVLEAVKAARRSGENTAAVAQRSSLSNARLRHVIFASTLVTASATVLPRPVPRHCQSKRLSSRRDTASSATPFCRRQLPPGGHTESSLTDSKHPILPVQHTPCNAWHSVFPQSCVYPLSCDTARIPCPVHLLGCSF